jgi:biotin carboxylase
MAEHVLVVGGGLEMPGLLRTLGRDVRTSVLCQLPVLPKVREHTAHQSVTGLPAGAPMSTWLSVAHRLHELDPFSRIAAFAERDQDRAAAIGESLNLTMHSVRTINWVHHKPSMRARLAELGIDDTPFVLAEDARQVRAFVRRYGLPCILKPAIGAGSIGVSRLGAVGDVEVALARVGADSEWTGGGALVERFHEGPQFSVEAFSADGEHEIVCCTRKYSDRDRFVEVGHVLPAPLPRDVVEEIARYVRRALDALEIGFGPTHTEVVLTGSGPRVIETHARLGGDRLPYLVRDTLGVDLVNLTVRQVLGETGLLDEAREALAKARTGSARYGAIWYATSRVGGVLTSVGGLDEAGAGEGVEEVVLECVPGARVSPLASSDSRLGYARARGETARQAVRRARAAIAALRFEVVLCLDVDTDLDADTDGSSGRPLDGPGRDR